MGEQQPHAVAEQAVTEIDVDTLPLRQVARYSYAVPYPSARTLALPVLVAVGAIRRPRLVCVAGVHGDEYEGVTALMELWQQLAPADLQGSLVLVPVANPPAFQAGIRCSPDDNTDMNRAFPGRVDGNATERLAYHLFHDIVCGADLVLSLHGWSAGALVQPYVEYPRNSPVTAASHAAAIAFGLERLEALDWHPGLLCAVCNRAGIPAIEPEIGGLACTMPQRRQLYVRGIRNVMQHLGMIDGKPGVPAHVRYIKRHRVIASHSGMMLRRAEIGDWVQEGAVLLDITDLTGALLARITSPIAGEVGMMRLATPVQAGDLVAMVMAAAQ